ncbi:MAG TPA: FAD-dependent oxidoreductase [Opitutaceae bacterium]|nr:FAD-dependent oxidoreductase [Opitutaceae bacterium]
MFGAGIAGLAAADALSRRGHHVRVFEALPVPGGFFRSTRLPSADNMPSEYSWHGMGPWYLNVFDLLRQIPADGHGTLYERALSRPVDFGLFPDQGTAAFYDHGLRSIPAMFQLSPLDVPRWTWLMLKTWTAARRSRECYARQNAAEAWGRRLSHRAKMMWRACFGPWIGSDWTRVSRHHAGEFFRKQLTTRPPHHHAADADGPAWRHGAGNGWLLLRGPSSEVWFGPWIKDLERRGVEFSWNAPLDRLEFDGKSVAAAILATRHRIEADFYVLATTPFAAAEIVAKTPELERRPQLDRLPALVAGGPHVQVSLRIGFGESIRFPRPRTAVILADTEFNLTLFAQEQAWWPEVDLGRGIRSLWTITSCAADVPGRLHGLPVRLCTKEQFLAEVTAQLYGCGALDRMVREANGGRGLREFPFVRMEVWHEWKFSPDGISGPQSKWVDSTRTLPHQPTQATGVPNLLLAGAHTRTEAGIWSIEGAVESGRRAARVIDPAVTVLEQHVPRLIRMLRWIDDGLYAAGMPHVLDVALWTVLGAVLLWLLR